MEEGKPLIFLHPLTKSVQALKETIEQNAENDGIEIYDVENPEEYNQLVPTIGQSLTIACQPKKCAQCIQPLKRFIFKNNVKILLINSKNIPPKTLDKFRKIGLTEYIQEPVPPKTLLYKINLILRSLKKQDDGDEMEYHSKEEKKTFSDDDQYEDKADAQKFGDAGHLKGKVNKNNHLKDGKDVFDDDRNVGSQWEETQEDPYKNSKEYSAEQAINSKTAGRLEGEIHNEKQHSNKDDIQFDDDLYGQDQDKKNATNKADQLGGNLQGKLGSESEASEEDDDEFDEDLFKSLEGVRKSSYKEEDKGGALRGDVSPTMEDSRDQEDEEDLFAALDSATKKSSSSNQDQGGHYKGNTTNGIDDINEEDEEDLFAALDSASKKSSSSNQDQGGHYKGQTSSGLDDIEDEEDEEDLFAALDSVSKGKQTQQKDQGGHYKGQTTPTMDEIEEEDKEEDLFASLDAVKSGAKRKENDLGGHYQGDIGPEIDDINEENDDEEDLFASLDAHKKGASSKRPSQGSPDNEMIDNEKGLERDLAENNDAKQRDEDLFESLAQHGKRKPVQRDEKQKKKSDDGEDDNQDEDQAEGGSIQYEKKGDLGEQTIDYRNLDKQPEYSGGTKEKLEIKVTDAPEQNNKEKDQGYDQKSEEEIDYDLSNALKKLQEQDQAPGYDYSKRPSNNNNANNQDHQLKVNQYSSNTKEDQQAADSESAIEEAKDQKELEEALNSIIIPEPKDMDFLIRATDMLIDGDEIKQMTSDYINEFCDGTLIVYNLQNECIMGSEQGPDNFEAVKNILKIKRKPSWNDDTFQAETLYYHCPIIENTNYSYFTVFFTTREEIEKSEDTPKRIEICLEALKGSYKSGEDRMTTKIASSNKSAASSLKNSVGSLFKGIFGKGRT
ncbi:hypothetical protein [Halobacteriovorax sp. YZS-1-1]|uniref:hypothetical protein n=1 Tax=unclassified Halobacteriovorax TaxID=2639665 RepID=UPI003999EEAA